MTAMTPCLDRPGFLPRLSSHHQPRSRLSAPLLASNARVRLLCAPAGSGKTALLSECFLQVRADCETIWLPLAGAALDCEEFCLRLTRALGLVEDLDVTQLMAELAHWSRPTSLFIDDYSRLPDPAVDALLDRLLAPHRRPHVVGDVNIHEVCERVRSLVLVEYPQGLKVQRDYDTSIPEFRGDREQLIQAVLNIAHNAAQALGERIAAGDAQITLRTRVGRQVTFGKQRYRLALELHVIDNGPGVPDSIKDRIFFPLVSGRDGGSGLGLTLAQTFVQQHHGLIECESVPGHTDFKLLIPLP